MLALSVIVSVPDFEPSDVGVNVTVLVQLAPAARELPQLVVWAKLVETVIEEMVRTTP